MRQWKEDIDLFLEMTNKHGVRMLMVGGGAVNFHGIKDTLPMLIFGLTQKRTILKGW